MPPPPRGGRGSPKRGERVTAAERKQRGEQARWGAPEAALERALAKARRGERLISVFGSAPNSGVGDAGAERLAEVIAKQEVLVQLQFRNNQVGDAGAVCLAEALGHHASTLRKLDLGGNVVGDTGAAKLSVSLEKGGALQLLMLPSNCIGDAGAASLAEVIGAHPQLEELQLADNKVNEAGAARLAEAAARHPGLRVLVLDRNPIGDAGAAAIANTLAPPPLPPPPPSAPSTADGGSRVHLTSAVVDGAGAVGEADEMTPSALSPVPGAGLHVLHLCGCGFGDAGALALASALGRYPSLRELHLSDNAVTDTGLQGFAEAIEQHEALRSFALENNQITDSSALSLVTALSRVERHCMDLVCNLSGNNIKRFNEATLSNVTPAAETARKLSLRGVTFRHMLKLWVDSSASRELDIETATTRQIVERVVKPDMRNKKTSVSGFFHAPKPSVHVIHSWDGLFRDLVVGIAQHATGFLDPSLDYAHVTYRRCQEVFDKCYFVDAFCIDQNVEAPVRDAYCQTDKFDLALDLLRRQGGEVLWIIGRDYLPLTRLWCFYEAHRALQDGMTLTMNFGLMRPFPRRRKSVQLKDAEVTSEEDKILINEELEARGVGLAEFDKQITTRLKAQMNDEYLKIFPTLSREAQDELEWLDSQDNAREDLLAAVQLDDIEDLRQCIDVGEEVRLERSTLDPARKKLARLMLASSVRRGAFTLEPGHGRFKDEYDEIDTKFPEDEEREGPVRKVVICISRKGLASERLTLVMKQDDEEEDMQKEEAAAEGEGQQQGQHQIAVEPTVKLSPEEEKQQKAEEERQKAIEEALRKEEIIKDCKRRVALLQEALDVAVAERVDEAEVAAAQARIALLELRGAVAGTDPFALVRAIDAGKEQGLDSELLEQAMDTLQHKAEFEAHWNIVVKPTAEQVKQQKAKELSNPQEEEDEPKELGMKVEKRGQALLITDINEDGLVEQWNKEHSNMNIQVGDLIIAINGITDSAIRLLDEITKKPPPQHGTKKTPPPPMRMTIRRKVYARRVAAILRAATKTDNLEELEKAIERAKGANLSDEDLQPAKSKLDILARRSGFTNMLTRDMEGTNEKKIQSTIDTAVEADVGVSAKHILEARKRIAVLQLGKALEYQDVETLKTSLAAAREVHVDKESREAAEQELYKMDPDAYRQFVRADLQKAIEYDGAHELFRVMVHAEQVGLGDAGILPAKKQLVHLKREAGLESLQRAIDAVETALKKADLEGLEDEESEPAQTKLAEVQHELNKRRARSRLLGACEGNDIQLLHEAIAVAVDAKVDEEVLVEARRHVFTLVLYDAMELGDADVLIEALEKAKAALVPVEIVLQGKQRLREVDPDAYRKFVHAEMYTAAQGEDIPAIRKAIEVAEDAGVDAEPVLATKRSLAQLEIALAIEERDVDLLERAIKDAEEFGVDDEEVAVACVRLAGFKMSYIYNKSGTVEQMRGAIEEAENIGVDDALVAEGRALLAEMELFEALEGDDIEAMQGALAAAVEIGVRNEALEAAKKKVDELVARAELAAATEGEDPARLKKAIEVAEENGVTREEMAASFDRLVRLELEHAVKHDSVKLLVLAIDAATQAGVEEEILEAASKRLVLLKLEVAAADLDQLALKENILAAKAAGIDREPIDSAKMKLKKLHLETYREIIEDELQEALENARRKLPRRPKKKQKRRKAPAAEGEEDAQEGEAAAPDGEAAAPDGEAQTGAEDKEPEAEVEVEEQEEGEEEGTQEPLEPAEDADIELLEEVIKAAVGAEVEKEDLDPARLTLAELVLFVAKDPERMEIDLLEKSLKLAGEQGLEEDWEDEIAVVKARLQVLQAQARWDAALEGLRAAIDGSSIDRLRAAIAEAEEVGDIDPELIAAAKAKLE